VLRIFAARSRMQFGNTQANPMSRFLDDIPPQLTERKSDDLMSGVLWRQSSVMLSSPATSFDTPFAPLRATQDDTAGRIEARSRSSKNRIEPFRQHQDLTVEFNQDALARDDFNQDRSDDLAEGSRIRHPVFGEGTITGRRGDVVDVQFDSGEKKRFALSIAPLQMIT